MAMPLSLITSTTVVYKLAIVDNDILGPLFPSFVIFGIIMVSLIIPTAMAFGNRHNSHQLEVDLEIGIKNNPYAASITRILLGAIRGDASEEDMDWLKHEMEKIENKHKKKGKGKTA